MCAYVIYERTPFRPLPPPSANSRCPFAKRSQSETCGGRNAFSLYKLLSMTPSGECSGDPVEAYEQCGGDNWKGSTCCADGLECRAMGEGACYSEVSDERPSTTRTCA